MVKGIGVFGPGVPGRLARLTPGGRRRMRFVLAGHLLALRSDPDIPRGHLAGVEELLRRYGGDPDDLGGAASPTVEPR